MNKPGTLVDEYGDTGVIQYAAPIHVMTDEEFAALEPDVVDLSATGVTGAPEPPPSRLSRVVDWVNQSLCRHSEAQLCRDHHEHRLFVHCPDCGYRSQGIVVGRKGMRVA